MPGTFNFTAAQTSIPGVNFVGHSFASFLLGGVNNANVGVPLNLEGRTYYYAGYAQDDFKVTPNLTLQLGLRYELQPPATETEDRTSNFDLDVIDPLTGMKGAVVFAGKGEGRTGRQHVRQNRQDEFQPAPRLRIRAHRSHVAARRVWNLLRRERVQRLLIGAVLARIRRNEQHLEPAGPHVGIQLGRRDTRARPSKPRSTRPRGGSAA